MKLPCRASWIVMMSCRQPNGKSHRDQPADPFFRIERCAQRGQEHRTGTCSSVLPSPAFSGREAQETAEPMLSEVVGLTLQCSIKIGSASADVEFARSP